MSLADLVAGVVSSLRSAGARDDAALVGLLTAALRRRELPDEPELSDAVLRAVHLVFVLAPRLRPTMLATVAMRCDLIERGRATLDELAADLCVGLEPHAAEAMAALAGLFAMPPLVRAARVLDELDRLDERLDERVEAAVEGLATSLAGALGRARGLERDGREDDDEAEAGDEGEGGDARLDEARASFDRGVSRRRSGDVAGALVDLGRAIALAPGRTEYLVERGVLRLEHGDHEGALEDLDAALAREATHADALHHRAKARTALGDHAGAHDDLDALLEAAPQRADALVARGSAKAARGEHAEALVDFDRALSLAPTDPSAHAKRALSTLLAESADWPSEVLAHATAALRCGRGRWEHSAPVRELRELALRAMRQGAPVRVEPMSRVLDGLVAAGAHDLAREVVDELSALVPELAPALRAALPPRHDDAPTPQAEARAPVAAPRHARLERLVLFPAWGLSLERLRRRAQALPLAFERLHAASPGAWLAFELRPRGDGLPLDAALVLAEHSALDLRYAVLEGAGRDALAARLGPRLGLSSLAELEQRARRDQHDEPWLHALRAARLVLAASPGEGLGLVREALAHASARVRVEALAALASLGPERLETHGLRERLASLASGDPDRRARELAKSVLGEQVELEIVCDQTISTPLAKTLARPRVVRDRRALGALLFAEGCFPFEVHGASASRPREEIWLGGNGRNAVLAIEDEVLGVLRVEVRGAGGEGLAAKLADALGLDDLERALAHAERAALADDGAEALSKLLALRPEREHERVGPALGAFVFAPEPSVRALALEACAAAPEWRSLAPFVRAVAEREPRADMRAHATALLEQLMASGVASPELEAAPGEVHERPPRGVWLAAHRPGGSREPAVEEVVDALLGLGFVIADVARGPDDARPAVELEPGELEPAEPGPAEPGPAKVDALDDAGPDARVAVSPGLFSVTLARVTGDAQLEVGARLLEAEGALVLLDLATLARTFEATHEEAEARALLRAWAALAAALGEAREHELLRVALARSEVAVRLEAVRVAMTLGPAHLGPELEAARDLDASPDVRRWAARALTAR